MLQVDFQSVQVRVWTVTLREVQAALTPAVTVLTNKLALRFTADVVESRLNELALQVSRKNNLQPCGGTECLNMGGGIIRAKILIF